MTKKIIGYTTGVFDLFHIGHLNILKRAKGMCDELIVGVTTDELAEKRKGKKPIIPFGERVEILESIKYVDSVVPQKNINELKDQERLKFNIIFKGDDWKGSERWDAIEKKFEKRGVKVIFLPYTKTTSSTVIRKVLSEKLEGNQKLKSFIKKIKQEYAFWKNSFIIIFTAKDIRARLPQSTRLGHKGLGVVINKNANIGENCFIGTNVTIGMIRSKSIFDAKKIPEGVPTIEDNVKIYANSAIIGNIIVGHDSIIGAGAIVYKDIPPFSLVVGNCKIYKNKYEKKL